MNAAVQFVHEQLTVKKEYPKFKAGDNITVNYKIIEGGKERIQSFRGDVIKLQGNGATASFTVRKISDGVGVERLFPILSPNIDSIVLNKTGKVRRAKLYYLRERSGRAHVLRKKDSNFTRCIVKAETEFIGFRFFCLFIHQIFIHKLCC